MEATFLRQASAALDRVEASVNEALTGPLTAFKDHLEAVNAFLDKIKSDGQLAKIYDKWMKREVPAFPDSLPDIPFTVK